jgi:hypothetical protein
MPDSLLLDIQKAAATGDTARLKKLVHRLKKRGSVSNLKKPPHVQTLFKESKSG